MTSYSGYFSYYNDDPTNIRNIAAAGGGALMDIGCYLLTTSRMIFGEEPRRVMSLIERDPDSGVDVLTSMTLDFPSGQAVGTCGTRMAPHQRVQILGARGRLEIEVPFNAPNDRPVSACTSMSTAIFSAPALRRSRSRTCDQYRIQGDAFSRAVLDDSEVPYSLEMSLQNMRLIEALVRSGETGRWESVS